MSSMEDQKFRTHYDSINVGKDSDSFSKELFEIRLLLQELVGKLTTSKPIPLEFQGFCGDNPELWISQAECYFDFYEIAENHKLSLASSYLDGEALTWYLWLFQNKQLAGWKHFAAKVLIRFLKWHLESSDDRLASLRQWSNITNTSSLQYLNKHSDSNDPNLVSTVFRDISDRATDTFRDVEPTVLPETQVCPLAVQGSISISLVIQSDRIAENSEMDHVFHKIPECFEVDSLDNEPNESNIEIGTLECMETPQVGSVKSVEVAELIQEHSSITEDQLVDELPLTVVRSDTHDLNAIFHEGEGGHSATIIVKMYDDSFCGNAALQTKVPTTVLEDTNESSIEKAENSLDNVALFGESSKRDTSGFLVPFAGQQTMMSDASPRFAELEYSFDSALWLRIVPCLQSSLEEIYVAKRNRMLLYLDFSLHNSFWVDTGQERNISGFLLPKSREHAMDGKIRRVLQAFAESYSKQSPNIRVNKVVKLLFPMFGLVHKSRTTWSYIVTAAPYLNCDAFPFDNVLNHLLVSLCVQTVQPRLPRPLPKPPFSTVLLEFLAQVAQSVEIAKELDFDGLVVVSGDDSSTNAHFVVAHFSSMLQPTTVVLVVVLQERKVLELRSEYKVMLQVVHPTGYIFYGVIEMVELAARHRLRHGLVAMKRFGGEQPSKIVHQYFKVDNFSFEGFEHITEYCLYHISSASGVPFDPSSTLDAILGIPLSDTNTYSLAYFVNISFDAEGIDAKEKWSEKGINADPVSHIREILLERMTDIPHVASSNVSKLKTMLYESLSDIIMRCFIVLDTSQIIQYSCHVIPYEVGVVQKLSKNDEAKSGILQAANQLSLLLLNVFAWCSQGIYNTPSCRMKFHGMNLEDKVLLGGGSIVVNQALHKGQWARSDKQD